MSAQAIVVLDALVALVAGASGLSSATVRRGSPLDSTGRPQTSSPCVYLWIASLASERGPVHRKHRIRMVVGFYVAAQAAASDVGSKETAAFELAHLALSTLTASPSISGTAHDVEAYDVTENGALPGPDGSAPSSWVAGTITIRYDVEQGI